MVIKRPLSFFEKGLGRAFENICQAQDIDYPLTIYYAFKQTESTEEDERDDSVDDMSFVSTGWETMLKDSLNQVCQYVELGRYELKTLVAQSL